MSPHALTEPQRWNRYAYAGNNPLKYVDPSGLDYGVCSGSSCGFYAIPFSALEDWSQQSDFTIKGSVDAGFFLDSAGNQVGDYYYFCVVLCDQGLGVGRGSYDPGESGGGTPVPVAGTAPATGVVDGVQVGLDAVSVGLDVTGIGATVSPVVDLVNGGISLLRADWLGAATSLWAAVPYVGISANLAKVAKAYPAKAGRIEHHHITPKYLGGDPRGPTVPLDAEYHQNITNAFRAEWGYGRGQPAPDELRELMERVYGRFPLPDR